MKTSLLLSPALLAAVGLTFGWTGCRSDASQKTVTMAPTRPVVSPAPPPPPPPVVSASAQPAAPPPVESAPARTPATPPAAASDGAPTATVAPQPPDLAPGVRSVVDLVHAQVGTPVLLEFIRGSTNTFEVRADDLVYLKDIGVPDEVVTAMLKRTGDVQAASLPEEIPLPATPEAPAAALVPATAAVPAPEPAPLVTDTSTYINPVSAPPPPSSPPPAAVSDNYFYSTLSPYGSWLYIEPHGWCWQPTVAVVDNSWRPYGHGGRWRHTTAGWYWQSSYSWGWAPFHYGNWYANPACGWVWVPGSTWGPAWVTWRYSDAYCGWAPLPPGSGWSSSFGLTYYGSGVSFGFGFNLGWSAYTFCGWNDCWGPYPYRHYVPRHRSATVYNNTTIVNNYYGDHSGNTVINHGVPPSSMPTHVRKEIRNTALNDITGAPGQARPERANADGTRLAVYRPRVPTDLKSSPTRTADQPYRPVRSRSEALSSGSTSVVPERSLATTPGRTEPGMSVPGRAPQRSTSPSRVETPSRSGPVTTTPQRTEPRVMQPGSPSRTVPRTAQPGTPSRTEPQAQSSPAPGRTTVREPSRAPVRTESPATPAPTRSTTSPATPAAPGRVERSQPAGQPSAPARTTERPPAARMSSPANSVPSRSSSLNPAPAAPNATRSVPPSRFPTQDYRNSPRPNMAAPTTPQARSAPPVNPGLAPGRSASPAPSYNPPVAPPNYSAPAAAAPPSRSSGPSNQPPSGPPPGRSGQSSGGSSRGAQRP